jgi:hypothetical protein
VFSLAPPSASVPADAADSSPLDFDLENEPESDRASPLLREARATTPLFTRAAVGPDSADDLLAPEPAFTAGAAAREDAEDPPMPSPRPLSGLRRGVHFEVIVLLAFAGLTLYLWANPRQTQRLVTLIPFAEPSTGVPGQLLDQLELVDLRATPERLENGRRAFIIVGQVVNATSRPIRAIQVEARLYDGTAEVARKVVFAGTKASQRIVKGWKATEIEMFEKIKPPKSHRLAPGDADDFLVIFLDPPDGIREFGCRVIAALPTPKR